MQKYKKKRRLKKINCDCCGVLYDKPISELKRNKKLGRSNYCSRSCAARGNNNLDMDESKVKKKISNRNPIYTPYRYHHRNIRFRDKKVTITLDDLKNQFEKQNGICVYSGAKLQLSTYHNIIKDRIISGSVDRIDSAKGYTPDNIQWVSQAMNYMKQQMSHEEMLNLCKMIADHYNETNKNEDN